MDRHTDDDLGRMTENNINIWVESHTVRGSKTDTYIDMDTDEQTYIYRHCDIDTDEQTWGDIQREIQRNHIQLERWRQIQI